jgi:hypothetical protein
MHSSCLHYAAGILPPPQRVTSLRAAPGALERHVTKKLRAATIGQTTLLVHCFVSPSQSQQRSQTRKVRDQLPGEVAAR